jgi:uncharacterized membrane-anchored protein
MIVRFQDRAASVCRPLCWLVLALVFTNFGGRAIGQDGELSPAIQQLMQRYSAIEWMEGPAECQIGGMAKIDIPEGVRFTGASGAQTLIEVYGNPPNPNYLGAIVPMDEESDWTLLFQFDSIGYVKDEDKDAIDADEILSSMKASIPMQNDERRRLGLEEMQDMSWSNPPFYDPMTNNLTWGLRLHFGQGDSINYDIRLLGRRGVMEATLLDAPETYAQSVQRINKILEGFAFSDGNKYAEWKPGDKVAAYGLTGLVAGGAAVAAAKTGMLGKFLALIAKGGKAVFAIVIAVFVALGSLLKRIFGGGQSRESQVTE